MQKVKTLFIFTFMVVILFGAYHVIYTRPDTPPPEVTKDTSDLPDSLELDLGTEISAEDLLNGLDRDSSLAEENSTVTAADNGQFESPAAGQLSEGVVAGSTELPMETAVLEENAGKSDIENPLMDTVDTGIDAGESTENSQFVINQETTADVFSIPESNDDEFQPGGGAGAFPVVTAPDTNDAFTITSPAPSIPSTEDNAFNLDDNVGSQSQLETPAFNDDNVTPANNLGEPNPISTPSAFATAWAAAQQQIETGYLREALQALSTYYSSTELTPEQHKQLLPVLDYLAGEVVYSRKHYLFEAYTVGPNDSLESIAFQLRVPPQLLANINGLRDPSTLNAGEELKIVQVPFRGEVNVNEQKLTLFVGALYAGRFQIEIGREFKGQAGQYSVLDKQQDRSYYAADGSIVQGGAVNNPYGKYWMDLGGSISIHTQTQDVAVRKAGLGSIKLNPVDARDVFYILSAGSQVTIR